MSSLFSALAAVPALLVDLVAVAIAVVRWGRHPAASMLLTVGVILRFVSMALGLVLPSMLADAGGLERLRLALSAAGLVGTVGFALVVAGVFADRGRPGA